MSMQLYITYESTTLDFYDDGYMLLDGFYPETPDDEAESVTDQFRVHITGSSGSDLRSKITAIRLALEHARLHKDDAQAAYINFDVDDTGDAWRSKLLGGEVLFSKSLDHMWRENKCIVTVIIERKPYWDSLDEIQVPLTNGNGSDDTALLVVYNHDDAGTSPAHDNWVSIDGDDILGDLPGPTRLEMINTYATGRLYTVWIGQNWTNPADLVHILEAEDATGGADHSDSGCSGGYYSTYELASGSEAEMFTWTLSDTLMDAFKGQFYKIMARCYGTFYTSVKYRLKLQYLLTTIWQSGQVSLDTSRAYAIRDLFTLRLPPWLLMQTNLSELTMILTGQQITGSPVNVNLDFLQLTPLDGWRMLECAGYGILQNERLVDDGFTENKYIDDGAGDKKAGIIVGYGKPIELYPGKDQKLYFLMHSGSTNTAEIARTISVKLFYRPRRRTL